MSSRSSPRGRRRGAGAPAHLAADREPLATLKTYREHNGELYFGQNLIALGQGELQVGMPVEVLE